MEAITKRGKIVAKKPHVQLRTLNTKQMFNYDHDCGVDGCITNHELKEVQLNIANGDKPFEPSGVKSGHGVSFYENVQAIGMRFHCDMKTGLSVSNETTAFELTTAIDSKATLRRRMAKSVGECLSQWMAGLFSDKFKQYGMSDWGERAHGGSSQDEEEARKLRIYNKGTNHNKYKTIGYRRNGRYRHNGSDPQKNEGVRVDYNTTTYQTERNDSFDILNVWESSYYAVRLDGLRDELSGYTGKPVPAGLHTCQSRVNVRWTRMHRMGQSAGEGVSEVLSERNFTKKVDEETGDDLPQGFLSPYQCSDLIRELIKKREKWAQPPADLERALGYFPCNGRQSPSKFSPEIVAVLHFTDDELVRFSSYGYGKIPILTQSRKTNDHKFKKNTFFAVIRRNSMPITARRIDQAIYSVCGEHYKMSTAESYGSLWNQVDDSRGKAHTRLLPMTDYRHAEKDSNSNLYHTNYQLRDTKDIFGQANKERVKDLATKLSTSRRVIHLESFYNTNTEGRATKATVPNRGDYTEPGYAWNDDIFYRKGEEFLRLMHHRGKYFALMNNSLGKVGSYSSPNAQFVSERFFHSLMIGGKVVTVIPVSRELLLKASYKGWRKTYNKLMEVRLSQCEYFYQKHMRARTNTYRYNYHDACLEAEKLFYLAQPAKFKERIEALRGKVRHVTMMLKEKSMDAVRASQ